MTAWLWSLTGYQFAVLAAALAAVGANAAIWGPVLWRIWRLPEGRPIPGAAQALANVQRPVWRMQRCGCTWMCGDGGKRDQPVVIICAGHWIDAYSACDYFHFEREIST